jgi:hypothetical protein
MALARVSLLESTPSTCTSAPAALANEVVSRPMVPGPQTSTVVPGPAPAAAAARHEFPPGSTSAPAWSSTVAGSRYALLAGTSTCSASAPGQPMMPISCRSAHT